MANEQNLTGTPFNSETARKAQRKSAQKRKENAFSAEVAQRMLNGTTLTEEEIATMKARGIENPTEWQVAFNAVLQEAKNGNYKAVETLLKVAKLYVEKTETENTLKTDAATLEEWKEMVRKANE